MVVRTGTVAPGASVYLEGQAGESAQSSPSASGVAWIDDTNVKVIEVVFDRVANGWSAIGYSLPTLWPGPPRPPRRETEEPRCPSHQGTESHPG